MSRSRDGAPTIVAALERAIVRARRRNPAMDASIFDFFREVMLPRDPGDAPAVGPSGAAAIRRPTPTEVAERLRFAMKFQQYTGPLQAKGLEDTAFYRYNLLLSLNEVGGDPVALRAVGRGVPRPEPPAPAATGPTR